MEEPAQRHDLPPTNGYRHAVAASGELVFVSGQVPLTADGELVGPDDAVAQTEQVFRNLGSALASAGVGWGQVVKLTYFLTDIADLAAVRSVRDSYLDPSRLPASSLVQVAALVNPAFKVEIEAVAARGARS